MKRHCRCAQIRAYVNKDVNVHWGELQSKAACPKYNTFFCLLRTKKVADHINQQLFILSNGFAILASATAGVTSATAAAS